MPPMEVARQPSDIQTNGDSEQSETPVDDSPQHIIISDSVTILLKFNIMINI